MCVCGGLLREMGGGKPLDDVLDEGSGLVACRNAYGTLEGATTRSIKLAII